MSDTYTCSKCKGVFSKGWSDEEAKAEHQENFGREPDEDAAVVCDGCFQKMNPKDHPMERLMAILAHEERVNPAEQPPLNLV